MANVYGTPVLFTKQNNTWILEARINWTGGQPVLNANFSKGIAGVHPETLTFTGATTNSATSVGTVSSFVGLYPGMTVTGSTGSLQANTKIDSLRASDLSVILDKQAILTGANNTLTASGGRYRIQFGTQEITGLTPYVKLLYCKAEWDETTNSARGSATTFALAPAAPEMFLVQNNVTIKTVPPTLATNSTDASIAVQFGFNVSTGVGTAQTVFFRAAEPQNGEVCKLLFVLGNSTAP